MEAPLSFTSAPRLSLFSLYHHHHQRKNGLFKKAYELGVLCSVDVAVIIFGERPLSSPYRPSVMLIDVLL